MIPSRSIRWSALACRLNETDVFLGLAAQLDDVVSSLVSSRQMVAYPLVPIRLTAADHDRTPLRVYAVRDPRIVEIDRTPTSGPREIDAGFQAVTIELRLDRAAPPQSGHDRSAADAKAAVPSPLHADGAERKPIMAFLMTVGLPEHDEDAFFNTVVTDFLAKSWMTVPSLLRELGCTSAKHIAEGSTDACPCN